MAPTAAVPQTAPANPATPPAPTDPMAAQPAPATPAPATPQTSPDPNAQAANPAPQSPATASAQPQATGNAVADVVTKEFPTYDKDGNGALSKTEFSDWMLALKTAADPSTKAADPATKTWMTQAFTQADSDKSKSVSKDELTNFLAQSQKAS